VKVKGKVEKLLAPQRSFPADRIDQHFLNANRIALASDSLGQSPRLIGISVRESDGF